MNQPERCIPCQQLGDGHCQLRSQAESLQGLGTQITASPDQDNISNAITLFLTSNQWIGCPFFHHILATLNTASEPTINPVAPSIKEKTPGKVSAKDIVNQLPSLISNKKSYQKCLLQVTQWLKLLEQENNAQQTLRNIIKANADRNTRLEKVGHLDITQQDFLNLFILMVYQLQRNSSIALNQRTLESTMLELNHD